MGLGGLRTCDWLPRVWEPSFSQPETARWLCQHWRDAAKNTVSGDSGNVPAPQRHTLTPFQAEAHSGHPSTEHLSCTQRCARQFGGIQRKTPLSLKTLQPSRGR